MTHLQNPIRTRRRTTIPVLVGAFALAGGAAAPALAGSPYTVQIKVPSMVTQKRDFTVKAYGESANLSELRVFLSNLRCGKTAAREAAGGGAKILAAKVVGSYTKSVGLVGRFVGPHRVCAYLTSAPPPVPVLPRARAVAPFSVVP